jgi:hypothetical protein
VHRVICSDLYLTVFSTTPPRLWAGTTRSPAHFRVLNLFPQRSSTPIPAFPHSIPDLHTSCQALHPLADARIRFRDYTLQCEDTPVHDGLSPPPVDPAPRAWAGATNTGLFSILALDDKTTALHFLTTTITHEPSPSAKWSAAHDNMRDAHSSNQRHVPSTPLTDLCHLLPQLTIACIASVRMATRPLTILLPSSAHPSLHLSLANLVTW